MTKDAPLLGGAGMLATRNTKEAALLYSFTECPPCLTNGNPHAMWLQRGSQPSALWFYFKETPLANRIHTAFEDKDYVAKHESEEIPDQYIPAVIALVKQMFHNFERLREVVSVGASQELPMHYVFQKGNKLIITKKAGEA